LDAAATAAIAAGEPHPPLQPWMRPLPATLAEAWFARVCVLNSTARGPPHVIALEQQQQQQQQERQRRRWVHAVRRCRSAVCTGAPLPALITAAAMVAATTPAGQRKQERRRLRTLAALLGLPLQLADAVVAALFRSKPVSSSCGGYSSLGAWCDSILTAAAATAPAAAAVVTATTAAPLGVTALASVPAAVVVPPPGQLLAPCVLVAAATAALAPPALATAGSDRRLCGSALWLAAAHGHLSALLLLLCGLRLGLRSRSGAPGATAAGAAAAVALPVHAAVADAALAAQVRASALRAPCLKADPLSQADTRAQALARSGAPPLQGGLTCAAAATMAAVGAVVLQAALRELRQWAE
jgi:hypothetical protein